MSDDKFKNIPTLEDVVHQDGAEKDSPVKTGDNNKVQASTPAPAPKKKAQRKSADRRQADRRKKQDPISEGEPERRVAERRGEPRRAIDQRRSEEMTELVEKIMQDMMPDLEQHLFMQLRFELQKYIPKILSEFKDKNDK